MEPTSDAYALALRAKQGDKDALARLVEQMRLRLFALAYAELGHYDDAHDAVAAAFLQICLHIQELRQPDRVLAWMQSIVRNESRRLRASVPHARHNPDEDDITTDPTTHLLLRIDVERALRQLPQPQEQVLRSFYLADLSVREIAQETGCSEGAVKMWLYRGRKRLAADMKGYEPMTTTPPTTESKTTNPDLATILHSDLAPDFIHTLTEGLEAGGYTAQVLTPTDLGDLNQRAITLIERTKSSRLLILDEQIGGRAALEYILNIKADGETRTIPMVLLYTVAPDFFAGSAFFTAGVDRLLDKLAQNSEARFRNFFLTIRNRGENCWSSFTEAARRVISFAQEEAVRWGTNLISPEHLLLGLLRDDLSAQNPNVAVRLLTEEFALSVEQLRAETERQMKLGPGQDARQEMQLTAPSKRVIDLAFDEARLLGNDYVGTEHLLLALLRLEDTSSRRLLEDNGLELLSVRSIVRKYQQRQ